MDIHLTYSIHKEKKIIFIDKNTIQVKIDKNNKVRIVQYNISHLKKGVMYIPDNRKNSDIWFFGYLPYDDIFRPRYHFSNFEGEIDRGYTNSEEYTLPTNNSDYPYYPYVGEGETETVDTPTERVIFPPRETPLQFVERITAKLFHVTQRIQVLRHEEPHQNALSEDICREVPEDHDEVLRYDISNNLIKRPVGWIALQMENYESKYTRYLAEVEAAKRANRAIPNFHDNTDRNKIETMLEKIEESLTEECLRDHFDLHRTDDWNPVQNTQRKITLCNDDANRTPGEVLVDVNAFFTDGRGRIAQEHAKKTYHDISTKYWVKAKRTSHRKLVTERIVEVS